MAVQTPPPRTFSEVKKTSPQPRRAKPFFLITHWKVIIIVVLAIALAGTLIAWKADHSQFSASLKKAREIEKHQQQLEQTISTLNQQHAEDADLKRQLTSSLDQKTLTTNKIQLQWNDAEHEFMNKQHDYTLLQAQFNDLQDRNDHVVLDEDRHYQLYMAWKNLGLSQRNYIIDLYADDLTLRRAAKEEPFTPLVFTDPDTLVTTPVVSKPAAKQPSNSGKKAADGHPQATTVQQPQ